MSQHSFEELEAAAHAVISALKSFPEFSSAKLAVIGGLVLFKYARTYRTTQNVGFLITVPGAPKEVNDKLLSMPSSPFRQQAEVLFYKSPNGKQIQINFTTGLESPYLPSAAVAISRIQPNILPYISPMDLLFLKITHGFRGTEDENARNGNDAKFLALALHSNAPIEFPSTQEDAVIQSLDGLIEASKIERNWWVAILNLY